MFTCPVAVNVECLAGLHGIQDAHQSALDAVLECELAGEVLLGQRWVGDILVRSSGTLGFRLASG